VSDREFELEFEIDAMRSVHKKDVKFLLDALYKSFTDSGYCYVCDMHEHTTSCPLYNYEL
jgi:hypothetical protein